MDMQLVTIGDLSLVTALFAVALAIAWARFGRQRYVALWSAAFLASAASHAAVLPRLIRPELGVPATIAASFFSLACALFLALGFRVRAGLHGWRRLAAAAAVAFLAAVAAAWLRPGGALHRVPVNACNAALFFLAARALARREGDRRGAARATCGMVATFALFNAAMAVVAIFARPGGPLPDAIYRIPFLVGAPTGLAGLGLFAMLLVASDLSDRLNRLAALDPLTGVLNRRGVDHAAARLLAQCRRARRPFTIVVADLDRFKSINDRFGHSLGDAVLQRFAAHCEAMVREGDIVGRLGGEEFVLVLGEADPVDAVLAMERLRAGLPRVLADLALPVAVTASFGIATLAGRDDTLAAMLVRADEALYGAKEDGRDRVTFAPAGPGIGDAARRLLSAFAREAEEDGGVLAEVRL